MYDEPDIDDLSAGCGPMLPAQGAATKSLRQQVFEFVRASGRTARADITRALDISGGSVTTLTADLIGAGFLREVEGLAREHGRGRPPVALEVAPDAAFVIGIKMSYQRHKAVLSNFAGSVIAESDLATSPGKRSLDDLLKEVENLIVNLLEQSGKPVSDIAAVGVGLPGMIDHLTGVILWSSLLIDTDQDFNAAFMARFPMPLYLDNDTNMLTLAELWFGAGRAKSDFVVVTIENGVGMGLVLNSTLYRGACGTGLELGHVKVQLDGALCGCGQRGCLEAYLADYALAREAATALDHPVNSSRSPHDMLEALFAQAKAGNHAAQTIFRRAGRYLSVGLSNVIQLFDPGMIILSGERMQYDYLYADEVFAEMHALTLFQGRTPCEIEIHRWGDMVWARGASALALSAVTDRLIGEGITA